MSCCTADDDQLRGHWPGPGEPALLLYTLVWCGSVIQSIHTVVLVSCGRASSWFCSHHMPLSDHWLFVNWLRSHCRIVNQCMFFLLRTVFLWSAAKFELQVGLSSSLLWQLFKSSSRRLVRSRATKPTLWTCKLMTSRSGGEVIWSCSHYLIDLCNTGHNTSDVARFLFIRIGCLRRGSIQGCVLAAGLDFGPFAQLKPSKRSYGGLDD